MKLPPFSDNAWLAALKIAPLEEAEEPNMDDLRNALAVAAQHFSNRARTAERRLPWWRIGTSALLGTAAAVLMWGWR